VGVHTLGPIVVQRRASRCSQCPSCQGDAACAGGDGGDGSRRQALSHVLRLAAAALLLCAAAVGAAAAVVMRDGSAAAFGAYRSVPLGEQPQPHNSDPLAALGRAVQVDPIKPMLIGPGTKRLKLEHRCLLSSFAFNFNLRRYSSVAMA